MQATELFERVHETMTSGMDTPLAYKQLHETLVLACHEGVSTTQQAFGNLFSQVDFLCKRLRISIPDKMAIQEMRRHSNHPEGLTHDDLAYDARALCLFISAIFREHIPSHLTCILPTENRPQTAARKIDLKYVRCLVEHWDEQHIYVVAEQATEEQHLTVDYSEFGELKGLLREGMQLNLLDCAIAGNDGRSEQGKEVLSPGLIVVEPDFMIDISSIAACFQEYGHHPLLYTLNRMKRRANTPATLLGNFAGTALDEVMKSTKNAVVSPEQVSSRPAVETQNSAQQTLHASLRKNFREKALEYCTCKGFNSTKFKADATAQVANIADAVGQLFSSGNRSISPTPAPYSHDITLLEPSFVCEQLGIQGRVDLMTTDMRLLVEQKSGRNMNIERQQANEFGSFQLEPHYVQLLLYYGVLRHNFQLGNNQVDIRLLYSKYPARQGLVVVAYYQKLFREAIRYRNQLVAWELGMARAGFNRVIDLLRPDTLNVKGCNNTFFQRYLLPELQQLTAPLHRLSALERAYFTQMMTFVYREQRVAKMGAQEGVTGCSADLWNMPLSEKRETGNIYTALRLVSLEESHPEGGYDLITLSVPDQGEDFLPNFRRGDMVYLYAYTEGEEPDVRRSILFRGALKEIRTDQLTVYLADAQRNKDFLNIHQATAHSSRHPLPDTLYAIEHSSSDASTNAAIRSLYELITAPQERRDLLLGQRQPRADLSVGLTRSYHPNYDDIVLRARQARDFFLLIGPPGTGKTSMALQYLVKEELLASEGAASILLMAYTNRAVDEICGMLADNHIDFVRLGNEYSCDERYKPFLMDSLLGDSPRLSEISARLQAKHIVVGTTSMLMAKPFIFELKHFQLAIVDEASQILEPNIVGLLATHRDQRCCIDKFILIGDHKQLPAVVQQTEQESAVSDPLLHGIGLTNCRNSLFERLMRGIRHEAQDMSGNAALSSQFTGILRRQGRMHPEIAAFPNRMFYAHEQLQPVPLPHQEETSAEHLFLQQRRIFIPSEFCHQPSLSDKVNIHEAQIVARLLKSLREHYGERFDAHKTVGVIVPYRNQIAMIRKEIDRIGASGLEQVSIDTVERYQGSQRDVIIYSFTVQHRYQLDFLTSNCFEEDGCIIDRKLNVAITRARQQMIITGNPHILSANPLFKALIEEYEKSKKE